MFPSSNSYNPFPLNNHSIPGTSLTGSSMDPSFWHYQAPFIDEDDDGLLMSHLLSQAQNQIFTSSNNMAVPDSVYKAPSPIKESKKVITKKKRNVSNGTKQGIPRKRTVKKDRHSKIYTAHGLRDRRMRLSLPIARKFFDLKDMLGFDKASETIEWLFSKSKAAIKELTDNLPGVVGAPHVSCSGGGKSVSSTSESEVVSATKECEDNMRGRRGVAARRVSMKSRAKQTLEIKSRKVSFNPVAKESRDKARARARERTREKMKMRMRGLGKEENCSDKSNLHELERLSPNFLGPFTDQTNSEPQHQHQNAGHLLEHPTDSISFIEKFLGLTRAPRSPSLSRLPSPSMFNYPHSMADSSGEILMKIVQ